MDKIKPVAWANKCAREGYLYGIEYGPEGEYTRSYAVEFGDEAVPLYDQSAIDSLRDEVDRLSSTLDACHAESVARWRSLLAANAKIDGLMFEFCPGDMTQAQMDEWAKHQKPVGE